MSLTVLPKCSSWEVIYDSTFTQKHWRMQNASIFYSIHRVDNFMYADQL